MSDTPENLLYTEEDAWLDLKAGSNIAIIGITDYAQDALSDIVYLEISQNIGDQIAVLDSFGVVESGKATSDLISPVTGTVVEINTGLPEAPDAINEDPYGCWMIKIQITDNDSFSASLNKEQYDEYCESR